MAFASRCAALLFAGTLIVSPLAAQNAPRVQHVSVLGSGQAIEVEIRTSATVVPQSQAITGPDRIVIDFPGALPAPELRNLSVNRGVLKAIRTGLFSSNPPITRIVLDLSIAQPYTVFPGRNSVLLKVGGVAPRITNTAFVSTANESARTVLPLADEAPSGQPAAQAKAPMVSYEYGLLRIHVEHATLAKVLFEIQQQTGTEIAIPAGAESEEIAAELGPGAVRDVLADLLNGSRYNFIFVEKNGGGLQKVLLTVRDGAGNPQFSVATNATPAFVANSNPVFRNGQPSPVEATPASPPAAADSDVPSEQDAPQ